MRILQEWLLVLSQHTNTMRFLINHFNVDINTKWVMAGVTTSGASGKFHKT